MIRPLLALALLFASVGHSTTNRVIDTGTGINVSSASPPTTNVASGDITSSTGDATGTGVSGSLMFSTGTTENATSGQFNAITGSVTGTGTGSSGGISLQSGAVGLGATTGAVNIQTGASTNDDDLAVTGGILLQTGNMTGIGATAQSGNINLATGSAKNYFSGSISLVSGDSILQTGDVILQTGNATTGGNGYSGNVYLIAGIPDGTGIRGNVNLSALEFSVGDGAHVISTGGPAPTLSTCGTSPSVVGTDMAGKITVGTGGTATNCVVTFARAYATAPACFVNYETGVLAVRAVSTTADVTLSVASPFAAGSTLDYHCIGL